MTISKYISFKKSEHISERVSTSLICVASNRQQQDIYRAIPSQKAKCNKLMITNKKL